MTPAIPTVKFSFLSALQLIRGLQRDMLYHLTGMHTTHGDNVMVIIGGSQQLITASPGLIRDVLVTKAHAFCKDNDYKDRKRGLARFLGNGLLTSDGEFWKRQRKLVSPALHAKRIEAYANTMVRYAQERIATWRDGEQRDIAREMNGITMRIVGKTMFNVEVRNDIESVHGAMQAIQNAMISAQLMPVPTWIPTPTELRARQASKTLDEFIYRTVQAWRASGEDKGDLLSMLLLARDDDGNPMTDEQARDEIATLFLAGHETTANALNWAWMLLAQHPHVAEKLHAELDSVLAGNAPTLADLKRLPYTEQVVKETLRLYPPAYTISRQATQEVEAGGYPIPEGTVITINIYNLHRNPKYWDAPDDFIPERFAKGEDSLTHRYAYLPFGGGARVCIGNSFAMMEAQLLLATIAQRFSLHLSEGQKVEVYPAITLNPKGGLPMNVKARAV